MKLNDLFEADQTERAARAVEHAEDELGMDASKSEILAFVKKMYGDEVARYVR